MGHRPVPTHRPPQRCPPGGAGERAARLPREPGSVERHAGVGSGALAAGGSVTAICRVLDGSPPWAEPGTPEQGDGELQGGLRSKKGGHK